MEDLNMDNLNIDSLINNDYIIPIAVFVIGICIYLGYTYYMKQTNIKEINNNIEKDSEISEKEELQQVKENTKVEFNDEFIETDGFMGEKEGYIFKNGEKGIGYYLDK